VEQRQQILENNNTGQKGTYKFIQFNSKMDWRNNSIMWSSLPLFISWK